MQERLSEQPTRRTKALPGAKYSPDEFSHFPDQPTDHDTEGSRADAKRLTRLVRGSGAYEGKYAAAVAGYRGRS